MSVVVAVSRNPKHTFSKFAEPSIRLIENFGVDGDAHAGATTQHLYRMRKTPDAPNLCQVHLLQSELFEELNALGIDVGPGQMGENVTTRGVELLTLPVGTRLLLGDEAVVEVQGLRDPCAQLDRLRPGLMKACIARNADGSLVRKAGIMGTVLRGGVVRPGDEIRVELPEPPWRAMGTV